MKQIIGSVLIIVLIISLVVIAFTVTRVENENQRLQSDLEYRSTLLADSLKETIEPDFTNQSKTHLQSILDRFTTQKERFAGLAVYDNKGNILVLSTSIPEAMPSAQDVVANTMDSDKATGEFISLKGQKLYYLAIPLHDSKGVVGALMVVQNANYIDSSLQEIWKTNLLKLVIQAFLLAVATLILIRWLIYAPVTSLVNSLKSARSEDGKSGSKDSTNSLFFQPLVNEITSIRRSLFEARSVASEEARLRLEKLDSPWTAERLKEFTKDILKGRPIVMVSNREPYIHTKNGGKISYYIPASGPVTAIEPIMQSCGGTWIAHGSGDADRLVVTKKNKIQVPPDDPKYTLRRIWLTKEEEVGYYYGFSNEGLWPLCHIAHNRPTFRKEDWEEYKKVNQKFADTVLEEIKNYDRPIVLVQDYQLALVPKMIKEKRPGAIIGLFWHIPWPSAESFSICPTKKEILDGMLGADLIGFHTQLYCNNFIETISRELESLIDFELFAITRNNHISYIKPFPISIAFPNGFAQSETANYEMESKKLIADLDIKTQYIGLGVDRMDYIKGILERLKAIEIFLTNNPSYRENFTFIQISPPSRTKIKKMAEFTEAVEKEVDRVNSLFKKGHWKPIILLKKLYSHEEVQKFYRIANVCTVTSLHDGMNLVAKEYIASRYDEKGVLILSQYTGASRELKEALIVNPYDGEKTAEAIKEALEMKDGEQIKRMRTMRETITNYNVYRWSADFLKALINSG